MSNISVHTTAFATENVASFPKSFDIGLFFNSSESRALAYSTLLSNNAIYQAILIDFDGGNNEEKKNNLIKNKLALDIISNKLSVVYLDDIFNYQNNLDIIANQILDYLKKANGKQIFFDITGVPLIYSVALTKFLFRLFPAPIISLLNVSGRYSERGEQQFSEGEQFDMYIPGFYGTPDHSRLQHFVFLLGYDGERSLNIYRDNLPDKISVIIPSPGYDVDNDLNTINNNKEFLIEAGFISTGDSKINNTLINRQLHKIDVSDISAVKEQVEKIYDEDKGDYDIRLVPLGPKPHAIGAALAAIYNNDISIMYQVPRKYYMSEIPKGDKMWIYVLTKE